jgi:hypothetical protein
VHAWVNGAVITAVLNDRIFYACPYHDRTQIRSQPVGLLEPLLMVRLQRLSLCTRFHQIALTAAVAGDFVFRANCRWRRSFASRPTI